MKLKCENGHEFNIMPPADDGWLVTNAERPGIDKATFPDGTVMEVPRMIRTPVSRSLMAKCNAPTPTDDEPTKMCGALVTVIEYAHIDENDASITWADTAPTAIVEA